MSSRTYHFEPRRHQRELVAIIEAIRSGGVLDGDRLQQLVRQFPKEGRGAFSKSEIIRGFRYFAPRFGWEGEQAFVEKIRMKPVRTRSGVAPVTVLTRPHPCPGRCIFCPSDVRMPKSYLSSEPGAQRAARHRFDPYGQTRSRLQALHNNGHRVDKVELIVLGGTWSFYPESYQIWFVKRCFDAMNEFDGGGPGTETAVGSVRFEDVAEAVDGRSMHRGYNQVVTKFLGRRRFAGSGLERAGEDATWSELAEAQRRNEDGRSRCVGLVLETRPDHLTQREVVRLRRLGATKVQIGIQSLSDEVLAKNRRGHDVAATRRAVALLRAAGFKIHAHWMPNLHGSDPAHDVLDFERLWSDPSLRPDELKIYPCSLIETAELMQYHDDGRWRPYSHDELLDVLCECLARVPPYCRVTRMIRDIPGGDIVDGNKVTNFRQLVERRLVRQGRPSRDIRAREIGARPVAADELRLDRIDYRSATGREVFLQFVDREDRIVGFCRLALPESPSPVAEAGTSAMLREVHVYGFAVGFGARPRERSQHLGLGRRLIAAAAEIAAGEGFRSLAVISAIGTRGYYRGLGFADGELYQHLALPEPGNPAPANPGKVRAREAAATNSRPGRREESPCAE